MKTFRKLQEEYNKKGISLVYVRGQKKYCLSIQNVPFTVQGAKQEGVCQLTGYYTIYLKERLQDVETMTKEVFAEYKRQFADNPIMLSYVK